MIENPSSSNLGISKINSNFLKNFNDSHEDEYKSSFSVVSEKGFAGLFTIDHPEFGKDKETSSNRTSIFRVARPQNIQVSASSSVLTKNPDILSLLTPPDKIKSAALPKKSAFDFNSDSNMALPTSIIFIDPKYIRAINDKAQHVEAYQKTGDTPDPKLREILKRYAIKRKETYRLTELVKKIRAHQSRHSFFSILFVSLDLLILQGFLVALNIVCKRLSNFFIKTTR